ncbi:MAG TPA: hypothetical protein DEA08_23265 [Planctomycetes bacterium]|nr:hypothetical protein [Planctomycetota bacterium]
MRLPTTVVAIVLLSAVTASAQGAGNLTKTGKGFRWKRGSITIELRDRDRKWTQAEADKITYGLDRLPNVLLEPSQRIKVNTFFRDKKPRGAFWNPKDVLATTVIDVGRGWVAYGDSLLARPAARVYQTVAHEMAHVAHYALLSRFRFVAARLMVAGRSAGWKQHSFTAIGSGLKSYNGFVSTYARTNHREDFAESAEFYWLNPDELRRVNPAKFRYMRDKVFKGKVSPAGSRQVNHKAINPVKPRITALGETKESRRGMVKIKGERFMGPRDGGYNRVHYRGQRALRLAVSRQTIHSWVPGISPGAAPVTVTTQDGKSNAKAFEVDSKPWWKFW